jgi:hypothetical protein
MLPRWKKAVMGFKRKIKPTRAFPSGSPVCEFQGIPVMRPGKTISYGDSSAILKYYHLFSFENTQSTPLCLRRRWIILFYEDDVGFSSLLLVFVVFF